MYFSFECDIRAQPCIIPEIFPHAGIFVNILIFGSMWICIKTEIQNSRDINTKKLNKIIFLLKRKKNSPMTTVVTQFHN